MKKLRNKIFVTIFVSLSAFVVGISIWSVAGAYNDRHRFVTRAVDRLGEPPMAQDMIDEDFRRTFRRELLRDADIDRDLQLRVLTTILVAVVVETAIFVTARLLAGWITHPVEEAFVRQRDFVADASHELKTPLAVISASTETYLKDGNAKWIHNIQEETGRMNELVTSLLDLAASEQETEMSMEQVNLSTLVESAVLTFESVFYERNVKLNYTIDEGIYCEADAEQIRKVFEILLDNASKYSKKRGDVKVRLYQDGKRAIFKITNKCKRMQPGEEKRIFDRFYKADASRNRDEGNYGLGLAIAKNIVERHGGGIAAEYRDGEITFKVVLNK